MAKRGGAGISTNSRLTRKQVEKLKAPLELDLAAFYNVVMDDIEKTVDRMVSEGALPGDIVDEVERMMNDEGEGDEGV